VVRLARESGLDALLVVDLPPGERNLVRTVLDAGLALVPYATLTDGDAVESVLRERAERPTAPRGYVHLVAPAGAVGFARVEPDAPDAPPPSTRALGLISARVQAAAMRARSELPVVVGSALGSGIDSGASARKAAGPTGEGADGIVVDGAITRIVEDSATEGERIERVRALVTALRAALDEPPAWA
jgi:tryptophan synthase alpha subunit